jgi:arylsulfatase A-like enzyme
MVLSMEARIRFYRIYLDAHNLTAFAVFLAMIFIGKTNLVATENGVRPNIIFIMADDLGYTDVGCFGSQYYETPNLDRLAAQGTKFLNYHHCQNCAPTRAALMSGQYAPRTGVYTVGGIERFDWSMRPLRPVDNVTQLPLDRDTIASKLQEAGYATGMFGKWHLGQGAAYHPSKRGFDEAIECSASHFNFTTNPKMEYTPGKYLADFLTDQSIDFITRHKGEPFFFTCHTSESTHPTKQRKN